MTSNYALKNLVASGETPPLDSRHLIVVRASSKGGKGIFAKADIPRGTRIIAESPLLTVEVFNSVGKPKSDTRLSRDVLAAYNLLSGTKRRAYDSLHKYSRNSKIGDKAAVFVANAYEDGVYWLAARFNHSCIPNVHHIYNNGKKIRKRTFHALRDIKKGEELTVSYIHSEKSDRRARETELENWGFSCTCAACTNDSARNALEWKIAKLARFWKSPPRTGPASAKKSLERYEAMAVMSESAGLVGNSLAKCYRGCGKCSIALGDSNQVVKWLGKELEVMKYYMGDDHPTFQELSELLKSFKEILKTMEKRRKEPLSDTE
ncbi:SET domain-containing protein [Microthyrium microscopicum]|uniref:SET domain-containing protein n=1 Tax=Microthyrium microscopicum TaxID=703497 RepID=A0A6A6UKH3_9PEZI|nr:SET domain-containing protein [Microthyrium microscopicum]